MKLSVEVKRILDSLAEQNGDDPIDEYSATFLYAGEPSTFNHLTVTQKLQYALLVQAANRDEIVTLYNALVGKHNEALSVIGKLQVHGNREQRRRGFK
jgi:hypothetical protein